MLYPAIITDSIRAMRSLLLKMRASSVINGCNDDARTIKVTVSDFARD